LYNTTQSGFQSFESEFFSWKNYHILNKSNNINFEFQIGESLLSGISYKIANKSNMSGNELAKLNILKLNFNQEISSKVNLQADLSYITTFFSGETTSPVAYEMLEGLKAGRNILWNISYNQKLSKVLYLNLSYNGRSSEQNTTIHNGSVQLRANF
jgi:hypothetical protein